MSALACGSLLAHAWVYATRSLSSTEAWLATISFNKLLPLPPSLNPGDSPQRVSIYKGF